MSDQPDDGHNPEQPATPPVAPKSDLDPEFLKIFTGAVEDCQKALATDNEEQIEASSFRLLLLAAEEAERSPTPGQTLQREACECEGRGDWVGAEAKRREVLAVQQASGNAGLIYKAHRDLSNLFLLTGDPEKAIEFGRAATAAAELSDISALQVMALQDEAICALRMADHAGAVKAASAALAAVEQEPATAQMRGRVLVTRARCLVAAGDLAGAERDLAESKPALIDRDISPMLAGRLGCAAAWWEVKASLHQQQGELEEAVEALTKAVEFRRTVASLCHVAGVYTEAALARTLRRLGQALEAAVRPTEASPILAEARTILSALGLPEQD